MNLAIIDCVLRSIVATRADLFGERAVFKWFEHQQAVDSITEKGFQRQSSTLFGRIMYRSGAEIKASDGLFMKVKPCARSLKEFISLHFFNESFFYSKILPFYRTLYKGIDSVFPRFYDSLLRYNPGLLDSGVLVFEDLLSRGYRPANQRSFLDFDHLQLMMRKIGQFHACSYRARLENPDVFDAVISCKQGVNGSCSRMDLIPSLENGRKRVVDLLEIDPRYTHRIDSLIRLVSNDEKAGKIFAGDKINKTHVLLHGNYTRDNVLFAYNHKGEPVDLKMVDLGSWSYGSPVLDLLTVLYSNADQRMRIENWDRLIHEYWTALNETFSDTVPLKEVILAEFEQDGIAYFVASSYLTGLLSYVQEDVSSENYVRTDDFKDAALAHLMSSECAQSLNEYEGDDEGTIAQIEILKDIIDRDFV